MWQFFIFNIFHFGTYKTLFSGLISIKLKICKAPKWEKIENKKMPKMLLFNMCEGPKNFWHHFGLFLRLFSAFHLKFLQLCKKPPSYISGTHQLLFPLVNNGQNWCQKLWRIFSPLLILQGECVGQSSNIFVLCKINNPVKYMLKFVLC